MVQEVYPSPRPGGTLGAMLMPLAFGVFAGLATALLGAIAGLDRDRAY